MIQNQDKISTLIDRVHAIRRRQTRVEINGLTDSAAACLASRLIQADRLPIVLVAPDQKIARRLLEDLSLFLPETLAAPEMYPSYNLLPYKFIAYHNETAAKRIEVLYRLLNQQAPPPVITTVEALLQKVIPRGELIDYAELVMVDEECDRDRLIAKLIAGGYTRASIVEEPGDFSVRGGILDVYSPAHPDPVRIEFFGDEVTAIRHFSATTQRKIREIGEAVVLPAKEAVLAEGRMPAVVARIRETAARLELPVSETRKLVKRIREEKNFAGVESLLPLIYTELDTFFDYVPADTLFINVEAETSAALDAHAGIEANYAEARQHGRLCVAPEQMILSPQALEELMNRTRPLCLKALPVLNPAQDAFDATQTVPVDFEDNTQISAALRNQPPRQDPLRPLVEWIENKRHPACTRVVVCRSKPRAQRLISLLTPYGVQLEVAEDFQSAQKAPPQTVSVICGRLSSGFYWPDVGLAVITEEEIFGSRYRRRMTPRVARPSELIAVEDLQQGDIVVHVEHGIGRYAGLVKLRVDGIVNDFLRINYRDDDKLYLPVDRMNMIQKYMGIDGVSPVLDKMGGKSWSRVKARVKRSAEKIAGELLKLYAARKVSRGHEFDTFQEELQDFEAGFAYEETADQLKAIQETMADLSHSMPMDRLICGDVGYGKTEVALRASFVAVYNGKQVAMLVPTTVLAEQHYSTFSERFKRFPVRVACLSRFRAPSEQRDIVKDLKAGKIDIVIGTHRLLSKDVAFKDLGLLVLDEEQRFGVKHKEKLKTLRQNVDVLTLTATPIPRTLHMSLMGIRDISVISTPPEYRQSIITYVSEFDPAVITEAIRKERQRNGQIFFIHNNIETIDKLEAKLKALVPEVRMAVAHGRMNEEDLEQVMMRFFKREIDMLLCTTIVESGLDIPSANTILVNRADKFGLAQMYQLRGRVGRSDEQAYAYLFIPHESLLTQEAQKRLKVLMEHSDLGSGFQIAMSDLQIRGGGTILGASQSGHIAAVGYEMFLSLMENAIADLKGEPVREPLSPEINLQLSAYLPESYIPDIDQRLGAYRRLARMTGLKEISDYKAELIDRYGPLPEPAANLLLKIMLKVTSALAGVKHLELTGSKLVLTFSEAHQNHPTGMVDLILRTPQKYQMTPDQVLKVRLAARDIRGQMAETKNILKEIQQHVNN
jgi:transcription-repair coupling factor (superfamily II helicase)